LVACNANGVGSRFRVTTNHMEDALSENDSRPPCALRSPQLQRLWLRSPRLWRSYGYGSRGYGSSYGYGPRNYGGVSIYGFGIGGY
jgi:hypothetical protein